MRNEPCRAMAQKLIPIAVKSTAATLQPQTHPCQMHAAATAGILTAKRYRKRLMLKQCCNALSVEFVWHAGLHSYHQDRH